VKGNGETGKCRYEDEKKAYSPASQSPSPAHDTRLECLAHVLSLARIHNIQALADKDMPVRGMLVLDGMVWKRNKGTQAQQYGGREGCQNEFKVAMTTLTYHSVIVRIQTENYIRAEG
jgi:hypothetical protein